MADAKKTTLKGSERKPLPGASVVGRTDRNELIEISIVLKPQQKISLEAHAGQALTHDELHSKYGAKAADVERIRKFASDNGLQVLTHGDEAARRTVVVAGTAAAMEKAFGVELNDYQHEDGTYRGRSGSIQIPEDLADVIQGVFGLDDRPQARPHFRFRCHTQSFGTRVANTSYSPVDIAKAYRFPSDVDGSGQTIAILELGGGYRPVDITDYFKSIGVKAPKVKSVTVDHGKNRPTTPQSADGEVMLDIEVAGAVAPGANIVVYFAPNTSRGFQDGLSKAIHDQANKPSAISISWGGPESTWTDQSMQSLDLAAQDAAALGITITVASGDNGSSDGVTDGNSHVDFPASSPHVLATGGTRLNIAHGKAVSETVWNDGSSGGATGGGYSTVFQRPSWQAGQQPGRGVPDVSGNADPETGYDVLVDGQQQVVGGTSAVAPLWAGLVALLNQKLNTRVGYLNPTLYALKQTSAFNDITSGNNGEYSAGPGWDATTGLGSPIGSGLAQALAALKTSSV
jgi:kumamolisin